MALLAVGSSLRQDDAAGLLVAEHLRSASKARRSPLRIFLGETAPENFTGQIKAYGPSHLLIVDSAEMGKRPGQAALLDMPEMISGVTFCTHSLPLTVMIRYLLTSMKCEVIVIGIQPKSVEFGFEACPLIRQAAKRLAGDIHHALGGPKSQRAASPRPRVKRRCAARKS